MLGEAGGKEGQGTAYSFGPHVPVDIIRVFFYSRFSSRKSQCRSELANSFYNTVSLKKPHFTNLNSFDIENNMLPNHSQKPFSIYKFSSKYVSVWCQKKHLHCIISWCTLKANICIFLYVSLRTILFQRRSKIPGSMRGGGRLDTSLRWLAVWVS